MWLTPGRALKGAQVLAVLVLWVGAAVGGADDAPAPPAGPSGSAELVANGGFEQTDSQGLPVGWRAESGGVQGVTEDLAKKRDARSGEHALRFRMATPSPLACFNRPLDATGVAGKEVVVSLFYRTHGEARADVGLLTYAQPFAEKETATPYLTSERYRLQESPDWRLVSWRLLCPAGAKEALLVLRSSGTGEVVFDDVSVRPSLAPVRMELVRRGDLVSLPSRREVLVRVHNDSDAARTLRLTVAVSGQKQGGNRASPVKVAAQGTAEVPVSYDFPTDQTHRLELVLEDPGAAAVCDTEVLEMPPLLTARVVVPAFRGTILSSIPTNEIVVEGQVHATEALCRELELGADLGGAGKVAKDGSGITRSDDPAHWRLALSCAGMLRGQYPLTIFAERGGKPVGSVAVQVSRLQDAPHETGYDARGRLCVDGKPVFVNGLYNVGDADDLPRVADRGFNLVVCPSSSAGMDFTRQAEKLGLMVIVYSPNTPLVGEGPQESFWDHATDKYGHSSAVVGWHLLSRPDASLMPFEQFQAQQAAMARADGHHPTLTLLSVPSLLPHFAPYCDILAFESAPVPTLPLETIVDELAAARRAAAPGTPVWAAIQSVGRAWLNAGGGTGSAAGGRTPTGAEHRCLTFLALVHGAQGLMHHGLSFPGARDHEAYYLPRSAPDVWDAMKTTNALVSKISAAILNGTYRGAEVTGPVHVGAWDYNGRVYVAAVNAQPHPALTTFVVPGKTPDALYPLDDQNALPKTKTGRFADELPAYGAKVYVSGEAPGQRG